MRQKIFRKLLFVPLMVNITACANRGDIVKSTSNINHQYIGTGTDIAHSRGYTGKDTHIVLVEIEGDKNKPTESYFSDKDAKNRFRKHYVQTGYGSNTKITEATVKTGKDHARMVTQLSVGQENGIATAAEVTSYTVVGVPNSPFIRRQHLNDNTVAISNSWGYINGLFDYKYLDYFKKKEKDSTAQQNNDNVKRYYKDESKEDLEILLEYAKKTKLAYKQCNKWNPPTFNSSVVAGAQKKHFDTMLEFNCQLSGHKYMTSNDLRGYYNNSGNIKYYIEQLNSNTIKDIPIHIQAAGNQGAKNPALNTVQIHPTYLKQKKAGETDNVADYWLVAVNIVTVDAMYGSRTRIVKKNTIDMTSNECGIAWEYCIGAYGTLAVISSDVYNGYGSGTSAAAPMLAGGLAVIKSAFPSKKNKWLRQRLLVTARHKTADGKKLKGKDNKPVKIYDRQNTTEEISYDTDKAGLSKEFGAGIMRLDLAVNPLPGDKTVLALNGNNLDFATVRYAKDTRLLSHPVFGDGALTAFKTVNTYQFDSMNAEFKTNMGSLVTPSSYQPIASIATAVPKATNIYQPNNKVDFNYANALTSNDVDNFHHKTTAVPYASSNDLVFGFGKSNYRLITAVSQDNKRINSQIKNANFSYGLIYEKDYLLGSKISGAFGDNIRTNTAYLTYNKSIQYNGWDLSFNSVQSVSKVNGLNGMINDISKLIASSYQVSAITTTKSGLFGISAKQPLRLERGSINVKYVTGIDSENNLTYNSQKIDITPTARQVNIEMFLKPKNTNFDLRLFYNLNQGHSLNNKDIGAVVRWDIKF